MEIARDSIYGSINSCLLLNQYWTCITLQANFPGKKRIVHECADQNTLSNLIWVLTSEIIYNSCWTQEINFIPVFNFISVYYIKNCKHSVLCRQCSRYTCTDRNILPVRIVKSNVSSVGPLWARETRLIIRLIASQK